MSRKILEIAEAFIALKDEQVKLALKIYAVNEFNKESHSGSSYSKKEEGDTITFTNKNANEQRNVSMHHSDLNHVANYKSEEDIIPYKKIALGKLVGDDKAQETLKENDKEIKADIKNGKYDTEIALLKAELDKVKPVKDAEYKEQQEREKPPSTYKAPDKFFKARDILREIRNGTEDVGDGIEKINKILGGHDVGYEALDPNFGKEGAKTKTAEEMVTEIKNAVQEGNANREKLITYSTNRTKELERAETPIPDFMWPFEYNKPDYNLDIDKALRLNPKDQRSSLGSSVLDKMAKLLEGFTMSGLISTPNSDVIYTVPNNRGGNHLA